MGKREERTVYRAEVWHGRDFVDEIIVDTFLAVITERQVAVHEVRADGTVTKYAQRLTHQQFEDRFRNTKQEAVDKLRGHKERAVDRCVNDIERLGREIELLEAWSDDGDGS